MNFVLFCFFKRGHLDFVKAVVVERRRGRNVKCPVANASAADPVQVFQLYFVYPGKYGGFCRGPCCLGRKICLKQKPVKSFSHMEVGS